MAQEVAQYQAQNSMRIRYTDELHTLYTAWLAVGEQDPAAISGDDPTASPMASRVSVDPTTQNLPTSSPQPKALNRNLLYDIFVVIHQVQLHTVCNRHKKSCVFIVNPPDTVTYNCAAVKTENTSAISSSRTILNTLQVPFT